MAVSAAVGSHEERPKCALSPVVKKPLKIYKGVEFASFLCGQWDDWADSILRDFHRFFCIVVSFNAIFLTCQKGKLERSHG